MIRNLLPKLAIATLSLTILDIHASRAASQTLDKIKEVGKIASLRHFKNDVAEVRQGFECGIGIEKFQDIKQGDIIEAFKTEQLAAVLQG